MSRADGIELAAPGRVEMQRGGDDDPASDASEAQIRRCRWQPAAQELALLRERTANHVRGRLSDIRGYLVTGLCDELSHGETYRSCLMSWLFYFFCHAFCVVFLHVCYCCACMKDLPTESEAVKPTNTTGKICAFFAKQLSSLWVTGLLILVAQWVLFRPFALKPHLGVSTVHQLELLLQSPAVAAAPQLRFNVTTYLLFKNDHKYYKMSYNHLAVSALYAGQKLGPADDELPSFEQKPRRSTVMRLVFAGLLRNASAAVAETFAGDKGQGTLDVVVRIRVTQAYKFWPFKPEYFTVYDCPLSAPFPRAGKPGVSPPALCKTLFTA